MSLSCSPCLCQGVHPDALFRKKGEKEEIEIWGKNSPFFEPGAYSSFIVIRDQRIQEPGQLKASKIKTIFLNYQISFILTLKGEVFVAVKDNDSRDQKPNFVKLEFPERVIDIVIEQTFSFFMTERGRFFFCPIQRR